jgi:hypothetical protein
VLREAMRDVVCDDNSGGVSSPSLAQEAENSGLG